MIASLPERFWSKVEKRGPDDCWSWRGARDKKDGRGRIFFDGQNGVAPRVAWLLATGRDPGALYVCHSCDNPRCVNPAHLWLGTAQDNAIDRGSKSRDAQSRRTHCPSGHEYTPANTILYTNRGGPERSCRECKRNNDRERMRQFRAANIAAGLTSKGRPRA